MSFISNENLLDLPSGFRFNPTDLELLIDYLWRKCAFLPIRASQVIAEVDLYGYDPWKLPELATYGENKWYFFTKRKPKSLNTSKPRRAAGSGYWKSTTTCKLIGSPNPIGTKKSLVFYVGEHPTEVKTDWIMHEYQLVNVDQSGGMNTYSQLDDWVLCRVFNMNGSVTPPQQALQMPTLRITEFQNSMPTTQQSFQGSTQANSILGLSMAPHQSLQVPPQQSFINQNSMPTHQQSFQASTQANNILGLSLRPHQMLQAPHQQSFINQNSMPKHQQSFQPSTQANTIPRLSLPPDHRSLQAPHQQSFINQNSMPIHQQSFQASAQANNIVGLSLQSIHISAQGNSFSSPPMPPLQSLQQSLINTSAVGNNLVLPYHQSCHTATPGKNFSSPTMLLQRLQTTALGQNFIQQALPPHQSSNTSVLGNNLYPLQPPAPMPRLNNFSSGSEMASSSNITQLQYEASPMWDGLESHHDSDFSFSGNDFFGPPPHMDQVSPLDEIFNVPKNV